MVSGHMCGAVVLQVIGGKTHLPDNGSDEHVWLVIFCTDDGAS